MRLTRHYLEPSAVSLAAEWLEADPARGGIVLTSLPRLALDPARFEVRREGDVAAASRAVLAQADYVVTTGEVEAASLSRFPEQARFPSEDGIAEGLVAVFAAPPDARSGLVLVPTPSPDASANGLEAGLAVDGDASTAWRAPTGRSVLELCLPAATPVRRVDVIVGEAPSDWPQRLTVEAQSEDGTWAPWPAEALRPTNDSRQRSGAPHGQVFVAGEAKPVLGLRIVRPSGAAWSLAEVRVFTSPVERAAWDLPPAAPKRRPRRG
jgi:hypothetical protein